MLRGITLGKKVLSSPDVFKLDNCRFERALPSPTNSVAKITPVLCKLTIGIVEGAKRLGLNVPYKALVGTLTPARLVPPDDTKAFTGIVPGA